MVAELVIYKVERIAKDLEEFAGHAKRSTINSDDVKLVARNNPKLVRHEVSMFNNHKYKRNDIIYNYMKQNYLKTTY